MADTGEVEDLIRYDILAQEALRGVVRKVLQEVERTGLPGEHHFYVTFDTKASGVRMSTRMREKYPDDMTIVIQHQFWDLKTTEHNFSIGLSFDNVPETMLVPFGAITGFFDPSVQFGLQFETDKSETAESADGEPGAIEGRKVTALLAPGKDSAAAGSEAADRAEGDADNAEAGDAGDAGADVVSLDAFRKK